MLRNRLGDENGAQRPDLPGAMVAFSPGDFDLASPPWSPRFQTKKHNVYTQLPSPQVRRSRGLGPSSCRDPRLPGLSGRLATLPTTPCCLSRSTSIIYGYSPPGQPPKQSLWGLKTLFLRCEDQGYQSRTGLRICPSPLLRSRAVEETVPPVRGLKGVSQFTTAV